MLVVLPTLAVARPARAQTPDAREPATFAYETPVDEDYLRAILEFQALFGLGFLWYVTTTTIKDDWDLRYDWRIFRDKLTGRASGFDSNHLGTNFIGHPLGGTGYYLAARSNRLGIMQSFGFALAGSGLWEYFGEISERVSVNDMVVTPLAGLAIGEATLQLGAFFDRSSPALHNRVLATVFAPLKSLNDAFDGAVPARSRELAGAGFPANEWHRFDLAAGFAITRQERLAGLPTPVPSPEARLSLGSRLARLPEYDGAGRHSRAFSDANVSSIEIEAALADGGLADLRFQAHVVLAGYYYRDARRDASERSSGGGSLIGIATAFSYTIHDYDRDRVRPIDRVASVQPLGVLLEQRARAGAASFSTRIDAGPDFGGLDAYALPEYERLAARTDLPYALQQHGYYFGGGGHIASELLAAVGPLEAEVRVRGDAYTGLRGFNGAPAGASRLRLADYRSLLAASLAFTLPGSPLRLRALAERRGRSGRLGPVSAGRSEITLGAGIGARF